MGLSKRQHKAAKGKKEKEPTKPVAASMTLGKALEVFLLAQNAAGHTKATYEDYERIIDLFLRYIAETHGYTVVKQITEADIVGWLAYLRDTRNKFGRPYSSRSIQTYSRDVSVFFHWLVQHTHLHVNPMGKIKPPKVEKALIRVFTGEELERLDAACDRAPKGKSLARVL